jgi:P27 family predicted phage terminase small subunit
VVKALEPTGILTQADQGALSGYCIAVAELRAATELLEREGRTFKTEGGYMTQHPAVAMQRSALSAIKSFSALLGLDPSSRSRLSVEPAAEELDEFEQFLNGGVSHYARRRYSPPEGTADQAQQGS